VVTELFIPEANVVAALFVYSAADGIFYPNVVVLIALPLITFGLV